MNRNVTSASSDVKFGELKELFDVVQIDILTDLRKRFCADMRERMSDENTIR